MVFAKNFNLRANSLLQGLNDFRLEVTRDYAQSNDLKELEARLTAHLLRIQAKLETTALKTEVLDARNKT